MKFEKENVPTFLFEIRNDPKQNNLINYSSLLEPMFVSQEAAKLLKSHTCVKDSVLKYDFGKSVKVTHMNST